METRVRTVRILVPSSSTLTSATRKSTAAGDLSRLLPPPPPRPASKVVLALGVLPSILFVGGVGKKKKKRYLRGGSDKS